MNRAKDNTKNKNSETTKNNNSKNSKNNAKNTNNVKVYTNNKNNIKLKNSELNDMKKWMKNKDKNQTDIYINEYGYEETIEYFVKSFSSSGEKTKYAHMETKDINKLPESLKKLVRKYDKGGSTTRDYDVHVFELNSMDDLKNIDRKMNLLSAAFGQGDIAITKIYKKKDQDLRLFLDPYEIIPRKTIVQRIKNMFTVVSGGKVKEFIPKERRYKEVKEGDVIYSRNSLPDIVSFNVGEDAKLGINYILINKV